MREKTAVLIGLVAGAAVGGVAGWLWLTEDGRRLRARWSRAAGPGRRRAAASASALRAERAAPKAGARRERSPPGRRDGRRAGGGCPRSYRALRTCAAGCSRSPGAPAGSSLSAQSAWRGFTSLYNSDDPTHAASIAYYALLSLFPFLLLLVSVLGVHGVERRPARRRSIRAALFSHAPRVRQHRSCDALQRTQVPLGVMGGLALIWASLGFFSAITSAVNQRLARRAAAQLPETQARRLPDAGRSVRPAGVDAGGVQRQPGGGRAWFLTVARRLPWLMGLRSFGVNWAATFGLILAVGLVFYFVPNAKVRFRDVWVGAVLTGLLWRAAFAGFSWYVRDMSRFSVHGSIGAVVVFLLWVYISAVILLYGVEFTAAYSRIRRGRLKKPPPRRHPAYDLAGIHESLMQSVFDRVCR